MKQGFFEDETQDKIQQIKRDSSAMLVIVRLRPLTIKQISNNPIECTRVLDSKLLALVDSPQENDKKRNRETQFAFDFVYDKSSTNKQIYDESLTHFLEGVLEGYNSTILAYGATGCGKTYTMIGENKNEGLCALFLIDLLGRAKQLRATHHVVLRLSYIEIYNQIIKDILVSQDKNLQLREDPREGVYAQGATEIQISSLVELATLLKVGAANRSKESTGSNEASSRSHALLLVKAQTKDKSQGNKQEVNIGKLSLVDLAGSQRAVGGTKGRQAEGGKINKSLLALGNCIQILSQGNSKTHVPFRQSKLTRLLKESLGGNCRTAMVTCISPYSLTRQETYNTLLYASRARHIGSSITRNVMNSDAHLNNYVALIGNLKRENEELKKQIKSNKHQSLPQLKGVHGGNQLELDRLSGRIESHFAKELSLVRAVHDVSMKLDKVAFKLLKLQTTLKKDKGNNKIRSPKQQKEEEIVKGYIEEYSQQKQNLEGKLQDIILRRGSIVEQIKNGEWSPNDANNLFTHYREKKIEIELEEIKLRQFRLTSQKSLKDDIFLLLGQQIKNRERIIEEQKIVIQKNNLLNRITYSRLNQSQTIPKISQHLAVSAKPSVLKNVSEQYRDMSKKKKVLITQLREEKKQKILRKVNNKVESNRSEYSLDRKNKKEKQSPKKSYKKLNELSPSPSPTISPGRHKPSQFDHIYIQR